MKRPVFHICTGENHPLIFRNEFEFKAGINILALSLSLFSDMEIYAFELMSNHIHILAAGSKDSLQLYMTTYIKCLSTYYKIENLNIDMSAIQINYFEIGNEDYFKNVVAYINRNAALASPTVTPYNYEWGSGRFYFNPEATKRYNACRKPITQKQIRKMSHSRKFDDIDNLYELDGYISPLCFCDIQAAESIFSSPRQYMYLITKNVETTKEIAKEIGETITFSDSDLYGIVHSLSKKLFETQEVFSLSPDNKLELAKALHYEYNAGTKQICRLLKISPSVLNMMF